MEENKEEIRKKLNKAQNCFEDIINFAQTLILDNSYVKEEEAEQLFLEFQKLSENYLSSPSLLFTSLIENMFEFGQLACDIFNHLEFVEHLEFAEQLKKLKQPLQQLQKTLKNQKRLQELQELQEPQQLQELLQEPQQLQQLQELLQEPQQLYSRFKKMYEKASNSLEQLKKLAQQLKSDESMQSMMDNLWYKEYEKVFNDFLSQTYRNIKFLQETRDTKKVLEEKYKDIEDLIKQGKEIISDIKNQQQEIDKLKQEVYGLEREIETLREDAIKLGLASRYTQEKEQNLEEKKKWTNYVGVGLAGLFFFNYIPIDFIVYLVCLTPICFILAIKFGLIKKYIQVKKQNQDNKHFCAWLAGLGLQDNKHFCAWLAGAVLVSCLLFMCIPKDSQATQETSSAQAQPLNDTQTTQATQKSSSAQAQSFSDYALSFLKKSPVYLALIWFILFASRRRNEAHRLASDYAHKEVFASSYLAYQEEIKELKNDNKEKQAELTELNIKLLDSMIGVLSDNPAKSLDNKKPADELPAKELIDFAKSIIKLRGDKS